ncbi:MAG: (2Fe-2S)-binding protein [Paracoccaceae bacterium]
MATSLTINGEKHSVEAAPGTPLLWVVRDELNLTGTKFGCGVASCGACTVHLNGQPVRSCQTYIDSIRDGDTITTIEGVGGKEAAAVQQAWRELNVVQCGYCQSGQMMSAIGLLKETPKPTDDDIDSYMAGNACRCATYQRIRAAIHAASKMMEG